MIILIYGIYRNVRDAAWLCLRDYHVDRLPVSVSAISRAAGIKVIKNSAVGELQPSESGISYYDGENWYVIYDDENTIERSRFTVAHEIGHIFLGHDLKKGYHTRTRTFDVRPAIEREADMFAARLLCPACVLWGLDIRTADDIARVCRVSHTVAKIRAERMDVLYRRGKFLTNPLEREVYENFEGFVKSIRA